MQWHDHYDDQRGMPMINILYCIDYLSYGGMEKQLISLIRGLDRRRFQPHLCVLRTSMIGAHRQNLAQELFQEMECSKIQLDFVSFRDPRSWLDIHSLTRFMKRQGINIVQVFSQDPAAVGLLAARLSGVKHVVASFRDMAFWRDTEHDLKMKVVYKLCPHYLANSFAVRNLFIKLYNLREDKYQVIHNGIDISPYLTCERRKKNLSKPPVVGIVATLNRGVKRVDIFLKAARYIHERIGNVKFVIAGEGELKPDLMRLCKDLGILSAVDFLGRVDNIPSLLAKVDVGVISSDSEGFCNAILEYMAAGVPVVATDVGGNSECIEDGRTGFLVQRGDYRALGERIMQLIFEQGTYANMQLAAYKALCERFTMQTCIDNHQEYYIKITDH